MFKDLCEKRQTQACVCGLMKPVFPQLNCLMHNIIHALHNLMTVMKYRENWGHCIISCVLIIY